jgi:tetratricopeptide (TPR) repeat protein
MMIGTIYDMQQKSDLAAEQYRKALDINPDFAPAANNLAYILSNQKDNLDEALALARKAKEQLPEDPRVMDTLGWIYYQKGLYDSAAVEFADSVEKLPDNPIVRYHLGLALWKTGKTEAARAELEKALSLDANFDGAEEARKVLEQL